MAALDALDSAALCRVIGTFRDGLRSHQQLINRLNVYPVPDGDTGTNMALTLESVASELDELESPDLDSVCRAIAHGSLMGARGNSGVILSQLLRGLTDGLNTPEGRPGARDLAGALMTADRLAREAVQRPVEGTILTVARGAAEGANAAADGGGSLVAVAEAARAGAAEALALTPSLLPVLEQAGVVDAGGTGFLLLFDALLTVLDERSMPEPPDLPEVSANASGTSGGTAADDEAYATLAGLRYEVMYLLEAPDETIPAFKEVWAGLGDSIVVVGRRRPVELPHPHRRGRPGHRGQSGRRPSPFHPGHRPDGRGGGGALGPRGGRRLGLRAVPGPARPDPGHQRGGRGQRRRHRPDLPLAGRPAPDRRRPVHEPVDRRDSWPRWTPWPPTR